MTSSRFPPRLVVLIRTTRVASELVPTHQTHLLPHQLSSPQKGYRSRESEEEEEEGASSVDGDDDSVAGDSDCSGGAEKSTVGRLVRFIGEKVWGAWN
jgi:hypothetical protein